MVKKLLKIILLTIGAILFVWLIFYAVNYYKNEVEVITPPFNGVVKRDADGNLTISQLQIESNDVKTALLEHILPLIERAPIKLSGQLAPNGIVPLNFNLQLDRIDEQLLGVKFKAQESSRFIELEGIYNEVEKSFNVDLKGRIAPNDLAVLGVDFCKNINGIANFSGHLKMSKYNQYDLEVRGDFSPNTVISLEHFFLFNPQTFIFNVDNNSIDLELPKATLNLALGKLSDIKIKRPQDGNVAKFQATASLIAPYAISKKILLYGMIDLKTKQWSCAGESSEAMFFSSPSILMPLKQLTINGNGNSVEGAYTITGQGDKLNIHPENGGSDIWSDAGVEFSIFNKLNFKSNHKINEAISNITLNTSKLNLKFGGRNVEIERPAINIISHNSRNMTIQLKFKAEKLFAKRAEDHLVVNAPTLSGDVLYDNGQLIIFEKFQGKAKSVELSRDKANYVAQDVVFGGDFNRLSSKNKENLHINLQSETLRWSDQNFKGVGAKFGWQLSANFDKGASHPYQWNHIFQAQQSTFLRDKLSMNLLNPKLKIAFSDADLTVRNMGASFEKSEFSYAPWQGGIDSFSANIERKFDGWQGSVDSKFSAENSKEKWQIKDAILKLPIAPPSSDKTYNGSFEVEKILEPYNLVEGLSAKISCEKSKYSWRGTTFAKRLSNGGFFFIGSVKDGVVSCEYKLPITTLANPLKLSHLNNMPELVIDGQFGCSGKFDLWPKNNLIVDSVQTKGSVNIAGVNFANANMDVAFNGVGHWEFSSIVPSRLKVDGGRILGQFVEDKFKLNQGNLLLGGGSAVLAKSTWLEAGNMPLMEFKVDGVIPAKLLAVTLPEGVSLNDEYSGTMKLRWSNTQGLEVVAAELERKATVLAVAKLNKYRYLPSDEVAPELFDFADAALKKFNAESVKLQFYVHDKNVDLRLIAEGRPDNEIPFVYENGKFRPKRESELGFWGRVTISSDYRIPKDLDLSK